MSPRFNADLSTVSASLVVLKPGDYEFAVGDPSSFARLAGQDQHETHGVGVMLTVSEVHEGAADAKSKKVYRQFYMHNKDGWGFAKQFVMACLGYSISGPTKDAEEERFNADVKGKDWGYNPDDKSVGDMWKTIRGTRVICSVDLGPNDKNGNPTQKWVSVQPLKDYKKVA
jgi:hypothetical protein